MTGRVGPIVSLGEAQAFVRLEEGHDDAILAGLIRTVSELCEGFLNQAVVERSFAEQLCPTGAWQPLSTMPIRAIEQVRLLRGLEAAEELGTGDFEVDLDADGQAWLRVRGSAGRRIEVRGTAGLAADRNGVPEPIRHGVLRMVAHLYASRDAGAGEPPATVTALWRPYRRLSFGR